MDSPADSRTQKSFEDDNSSEKLGKNAASDFETELQTNISAFEALERDFQDVLQELMGDQSLEKFRLEYEKLHRALKKSHEQEKRLVKRCRELNTEIVNNAAKIKTTLRLSQEDQKNIAHLTKEMDRTWKLVYASQEKEQRAKETINQLKEEMANLSKLVERGAGLSLNQENLVKELRQAKEELQRQVDEQTSQISVLEENMQEQLKVQGELRSEHESTQKTITELRERLATKDTENVRETRRREKTQKELQDCRVRLDEKARVEEGLNVELSKKSSQISELDRQLNDAKATMDKYLRDYDTLFTKTQKVTEDLEAQIAKNKRMHADQVALEKEAKLRQLEIGRLKTDKDLVERKFDKEHRDKLQLTQMLEDSKTPLQVARGEIESLQKDLHSSVKQEAQLVRNTDKLTREKDVHMRATVRAEGKAKDIKDTFDEQQRVLKSVTEELDQTRSEVQTLRNAILHLEKDRERLGNELTDQKAEVAEGQDELRMRDVLIAELKKQISEWESKLKQQQQLYESVRADRNHYSKSLLEAQDEVAELRKKFKIMGHQIDQLKEEVSSKDQALVKEHFDLQRAEKLRESCIYELTKNKQLIASNHELIHRQDEELKRLALTIKRMDEEALAQRKEYDQVINERDILGTQLIRRNDELALLYEKLRVQQSALRNGEAQYSTRLTDIRLLRLQVKELSRENLLGRGASGQIEEMRREILHLQRELLQEKTKVTALSEELENPMNVHRWRKLEGSDPAMFELIQKIQTLQRRLISKTEEVVEKGLMLQEKDKIYAELKAILARQPGPEVAEQLTVYQQNLKQKTRQMKSMASEMNMLQAQVNEYKYDIERLNRELQDLKKKYYQQKRKDQMQQEMLSVEDGSVHMSRTAPSALRNEQIIAAKSARVRFTGGGFAVR